MVGIHGSFPSNEGCKEIQAPFPFGEAVDSSSLTRMLNFSELDAKGREGAGLAQLPVLPSPPLQLPQQVTYCSSHFHGYPRQRIQKKGGLLLIRKPYIFPTVIDQGEQNVQNKRKAGELTSSGHC